MYVCVHFHADHVRSPLLPTFGIFLQKSNDLSIRQRRLLQQPPLCNFAFARIFLHFTFRVIDSDKLSLTTCERHT